MQREAQGSPIVPANQGSVHGWASAPLPGFSGLLALSASSLCFLAGSESRDAGTLPGHRAVLLWAGAPPWGHGPCTELTGLMPLSCPCLVGTLHAESSEGACRGDWQTWSPCSGGDITWRHQVVPSAWETEKAKEVRRVTSEGLFWVKWLGDTSEG